MPSCSAASRARQAGLHERAQQYVVGSCRVPGSVVLLAKWASARISMNPWAGQTIRIVIGAADGATDSRVEAAVDDLRIERP